MASDGLKRRLEMAFPAAGVLEKLTELTLLFALLTIATASVTSVLVAPDWGMLWTSLMLGLLVGWVLALFRGSALGSACIVLGLGFYMACYFPAD